MTGFRPTAATHQMGARTLERDAFISPAVFAAEQERIFARMWNCVGRSSAVASPGDFILADIAGESLIVTRGDDERARAFFNVCRHRGTRIQMEEAGCLGATFRCPYHGWSYARDGRLVAAPHTQDIPGFRLEAHGLHEAAVAEWEGFLFVNISSDPEPFVDAWAPMLKRLERFNLGRLVAHRAVEYEVLANWKLVFENFSECLHCPTIHPELSFILPYQSGANDLTDGPFLGGYMEIREPHESATVSGHRAALFISEDLPAAERRRAYYYTLMPNMMLGIHPDYVNFYTVRPVAVDRTIITAEWLFHPASMLDPAFSPGDAVEFWDMTNRQDWAVVEASHAGVASRRYTPGPYTPRESLPAAWDREYERLMRKE
jgi:glycine betaine catabolism A